MNNVLGGGSYGIVYKKEINGKEYAVKRIKIDEERGIPCDVLNETMCLNALKHKKNIVQIQGINIDEKDMYCYIILELMEKNLHKYITENAFKPKNVRQIMMNIVLGLAHIHGAKIIHRDLKPQNILINGNDPSSVRICDFGLSTQVSVESNLDTYVTTCYYRAPELVFGVSEYKYNVDIWSLGCVFAELITKTPIFLVVDDIYLLKTIARTIKPSLNMVKGEVMCSYDQFLAMCSQHETRLPEKYNIIGACGVDLLSKMLEIDPKKRISLEEVMYHPYFTDLF